jgi:hypothetical protein
MAVAPLAVLIKSFIYILNNLMMSRALSQFFALAVTFFRRVLLFKPSLLIFFALAPSRPGGWRGYSSVRLHIDR